ncbi:MAG: hypothetical protein AAGU15_08400 [Anaerolineaceae bacterium]|jgi:hypothetical protein
MIIHLSQEWSLDVPEDLQHRKEGDHVVFWKEGMTLITTIFAYSGEKQRQVLLANLKGRVEADKLESIVDNDGEIQRYAYLQPEEVIPGHTRLAVHAFTTALYGVLQTSFYIDNSDDLQECLQIWKSVEWADFS